MTENRDSLTDKITVQSPIVQVQELGPKWVTLEMA